MNSFALGLLRKNSLIFKQYTRLRREYAYALNPEKASVAFEIIPALLSINEPDLPGYVPDGEDSCGVYGIGTSNDLKNVMHQYFPEMKSREIHFQKYFVTRSIVESLFVMGSVGTVAQTEKSDFDFWVCVDSSHVGDRHLRQIQKKTEQISWWCESKFDMEVHFFISELDRIRANDFGSVDEESTGSSQKRFLKEECYRTMLLVAGKIPLWWVLPPGTGQEEYDRISAWMKEDGTYECDEFLDLGFLGDISKEEFLGTALWHLSKGIKEPFKAVLKMAMMDWYLSHAFQGRLLCDLVKERVMTGAKKLLDMDPYLVMVEMVLNYYTQENRSEDLELVRKAFYLKTNPMITRVRLKRGMGDYKTEVFRGLIEKWEWSLDTVEELNQMEKWSYARHLKLSTDINKFFFSTYRRLSDNQLLKEKQAINDLDLTILGRKIYVLFSKQQKKLQVTPFLTGRKLVLDRCLFQYRRDRSGHSQWTLYDATRYPLETSKKGLRIFSAERIVRAATWLVIDGIYDSHATVVEMPYNPSGVSVNELVELLGILQDFFPPALRQISMGSNLMDGAKCDQMMVIQGLEEGKGNEGPLIIDLVYSNTWGEIFTEFYPFQEGLSVITRYVADMPVNNPAEAISKVKIYLPKSEKENGLRKLIYQAVLQGLAETS